MVFFLWYLNPGKTELWILGVLGVHPKGLMSEPWFVIVLIVVVVGQISAFIHIHSHCQDADLKEQ